MLIIYTSSDKYIFCAKMLNITRLVKKYIKQLIAQSLPARHFSTVRPFQCSQFNSTADCIQSWLCAKAQPQKQSGNSPCDSLNTKRRRWIDEAGDKTPEHHSITSSTQIMDQHFCNIAKFGFHDFQMRDAEQFCAPPEKYYIFMSRHDVGVWARRTATHQSFEQWGGGGVLV